MCFFFKSFFLLSFLFSLYYLRITWLPLVLLTISMIGFNLGLASGMFVLLGEIIPIRIKNEANAVMNLVLAGFTSLAILIYQYLTATVNGSGTFMFFSACCFIVVGYTLVGLPETKGQSLRTIERRMTATSLNSKKFDDA